MAANRLGELKKTAEFLREWLVKLDADASRPDDGWPLTREMARYPEFRDMLRGNGLSALADCPAHEFDLLKLALYPWTPNSGAAATARTVRRELTEVECSIGMLEHAP